MEKLPKEFNLNQDLINKLAFSEDLNSDYRFILMHYDRNLDCIAWDSLRIYYGTVLSLYPFTEEEKLCFDKLNNKQKFGYLTRRNIRIYNHLKLDKFLLDYYFKLKKQYKLYKKPNISIDIDDIIEGKFTREDVVFKKHTVNFTDITISIISSILEKSKDIFNQAISEARNKKLEDKVVL